MDKQQISPLPRFLERLGLDEEPLGVFYTDKEPAQGLSPDPLPLPSREREMKNEIDWQEIFGNFSCVMGNIWRARKKKTAAWFSTKTWKVVQKKIERSRKAWGESEA